MLGEADMPEGKSRSVSKVLRSPEEEGGRIVTKVVAFLWVLK